jgi:regulator of replication initiation timing
MMTHMDQRIGALQTHMDGHHTTLVNRVNLMSNQFDSLHDEVGELRMHIRETVHDPIMNRMNNM